MIEYESHEFSYAMARTPGSYQLGLLVASMRTNGFDPQPNPLYEGQILDGWNRYPGPRSRRRYNRLCRVSQALNFVEMRNSASTLHRTAGNRPQNRLTACNRARSVRSRGVPRHAFPYRKGIRRNRPHNASSPPLPQATNTSH